VVAIAWRRLLVFGGDRAVRVRKKLGRTQWWWRWQWRGGTGAWAGRGRAAVGPACTGCDTSGAPTGSHWIMRAWQSSARPWRY